MQPSLRVPIINGCSRASSARFDIKTEGVIATYPRVHVRRPRFVHRVRSARQDDAHNMVLAQHLEGRKEIGGGWMVPPGSWRATTVVNIISPSGDPLS